MQRSLDYWTAKLAGMSRLTLMCLPDRPCGLSDRPRRGWEAMAIPREVEQGLRDSPCAGGQPFRRAPRRLPGLAAKVTQQDDMASSSFGRTGSKGVG